MPTYMYMCLLNDRQWNLPKRPLPHDSKGGWKGKDGKGILTVFIAMQAMAIYGEV